MFDVKDCISFLTNQGAKELSESMNQRFKEKGGNVTRVQWTALFYIDQNPGITQKELAGKMMVTEPTLMHLIDRMEKDGLVSREYNKENRRYRYLCMTEDGERVFRILMPVAEEFNKEATKGISEQDMETFKYVIKKMIDNIKCE